MSDNKRILSGLVWTIGEKFCSQLTHMVISIILARLLVPEYYGVISITVVFINIAEVFITSGFGNALIQKKNADEEDYSSLFWLSLGISLVLYLVLFSIAPFISVFYGNKDLTAILRVMSLSVPISALNTIQRAHVSKQMRFRKFFFSTTVGTLISGAIGIAMAYSGCSIWALVAQYLINIAVNTFVLWFTSGWTPKFIFNKDRVKPLFSYSWKLMLSQFLSKLTENIRSLIIGKVFSPTDLAYYDRGHAYPNKISNIINSSISLVMFPAASSKQNDLKLMKTLAKRAISICCLVMAPLLLSFAFCAESLVRIFLTETWLPCVPFLQIYCIFYLFVPVNTINLQIIKAQGRSDLVLIIEFVKKIFEILVILFTVFVCKSVLAIAIGSIISCLFSVVINTSINRKIILYGFFEQIWDIIKTIIPSFIAVLITYCITLNIASDILRLVISFSMIFLIYILLLLVFDKGDVIYLFNMAKQFFVKK